MQKIHIGSKINLVEVPEKPSFDMFTKAGMDKFNEYEAALQHAIDNPIAEFENHTDTLACFGKELGTNMEGLHDIPEGYMVEVKEEPMCESECKECGYESWEACLENGVRKKIASLVPIKEESETHYKKVIALADQRELIAQVLEKHYSVAMNDAVHEIQKIFLPDLIKHDTKD